MKIFSGPGRGEEEEEEEPGPDTSRLETPWK
jgi:hypothetical protein